MSWVPHCYVNFLSTNLQKSLGLMAICSKFLADKTFNFADPGSEQDKDSTQPSSKRVERGKVKYFLGHFSSYFSSKQYFSSLLFCDHWIYKTYKNIQKNTLRFQASQLLLLINRSITIISIQIKWSFLTSFQNKFTAVPLNNEIYYSNM